MITILEDTRQQEKKHENKHKYFREHNILWRRVALDCGDYTLPNDRSVAIDTKMSIEEFIGDIQIKQMPKKEVEAVIDQIGDCIDLDSNKRNVIYHLITDDDLGRFPEGEIAQFCWNNRIEGIIYQCCVMRKKGKVNECVGSIYMLDKPDESEKNRILIQFPGAYKVTVKTTTAEKEFQNLYVQRQGFLHRDIKRAVNNCTRFIILIETKAVIKSIDDVERYFINKRQWLYEQKIRKEWKIPKEADFEVAVMELRNHGAEIKAGPQDGKKVAQIMRTMEEKYGIEFQFCIRSMTGKRILELLGIDKDTEKAS